MRSSVRASLLRGLAALALAVAVLPGCAGGWRGAPPAGWGDFVDPGHGPESAVTVAPPSPPATVPGAGATAAAQPSGDGVEFRWKGSASSVALAGEFNAWNTSADPLAQQPDGTWRIVKKLEPGRYAYKFVIDGGRWEPDPNAAETVDDGYGGKNSVVVVGAGAPSASAPAAPAPSGATGTAKPPAQTADGVTFTFAGAATSVALAGDFNAWAINADMMRRQADGSWTITKKLAPGSYAYKFVVNGTTWKIDEANPESKDDGFGGKNSIVTVK